MGWYVKSVQLSASANATAKYLHEVDLAAAAGNVVLTLPASGSDPLYVGVVNASTVADGSKVIIVQTAAAVEVVRLSAAGESVWVGRNPATGAWEQLAHDNPSEYQWTWANAAARNACQVSAAQAGQAGHQSDMALEYKLLATTGAAGTNGPRWGRLDPAGWAPIHSFNAIPGAAVLSTLGVAAGLVGFTQTLRTPSVSSTSKALTIARMGLVGASTLASVGNYRTGGFATALAIGGVPLRFRHLFTTGPAVTASQRYYYGITSDAPTTNVDPNTFLNAIGLGRSSGADANWQIYQNNGAGAATKTDTTLPTGTANKLMELEYWTIDGTSWWLQLANLSDGGELSFPLTGAKLPLTSIGVLWTHYSCNNAEATAHGPDVCDFQVSQQIR